MRVMILVKASPESEAGEMPSAELMREMGAFNQKLVDAGVMKDGDGLKPTSFAKRVVFDGVDRVVVDGPFGPPNELVAGYWIWEVADMDEAVAWVRQCPNPMPSRSTIEIRPFFEMEDFGEAMPDDVAAHESEMRKTLGT